MATRRPDLRRAHAGQSLLEGALAFLVLVLLALALVQFALYVHAQNVVTGAAQDGARVATAKGATLDQGLAYTRTLLTAGLGRTAQQVSVSGRDDGATVVVEVHGGLRLLLPTLIDAHLPLVARAIAQKEDFRVP